MWCKEPSLAQHISQNQGTWATKLFSPIPIFHPTLQNDNIDKGLSRSTPLFQYVGGVTMKTFRYLKTSLFYQEWYCTWQYTRKHVHPTSLGTYLASKRGRNYIFNRIYLVIPQKLVFSGLRTKADIDPHRNSKFSYYDQSMAYCRCNGTKHVKNYLIYFTK